MHGRTHQEGSVRLSESCQGGEVEREEAKMAARPIASYFRTGLNQTGAKVSLQLGRAACSEQNAVVAERAFKHALYMATVSTVE